MRKLHKGLIIGGATLAVLVPAGLVAADQIDMGHGPGQGRGNGSMTHDCTRNGTGTGTQTNSQMQKRDGTGPNHAANSANRPGATTTTTGTSGSVTTQRQYGPMNGSGGQMRRGG